MLVHDDWDVVVALNPHMSTLAPEGNEGARTYTSVLMSRMHPTVGPSAVLFDMDGTLVDSEHLWLASEIEVMHQLGSDWDPQDQAHCLGGPLERVADYMKERSGTWRSAQDVGHMLLSTIERHMRNEPLRWRPGAVALLRECIEAEVPRALVTASWGVLVEALADRMNAEIGEIPFTTVVAGDDVQNSKPHPEPYQRAAAAVGKPAHECLAIEDSPTGVASAIAAGCRVIAVPQIAPVDHVVAGFTHVALVDSLAEHNLSALWHLVGEY